MFVYDAGRAAIRADPDSGVMGENVDVMNGTISDSGGPPLEPGWATTAGVYFYRTGTGCSVTNVDVVRGFTTDAVYVHASAQPVDIVDVTYTA